MDSSFAGRTALNAACQAGHLECVAMLLQFGATRRLRDGSGNEPIHVAAQGGSSSIVRLLLSARLVHSTAPAIGPAHPTENQLVDTEDDATGPQGAEQSNQAPIDELSDVNSRNAMRQTPLHLAVNRHDYMIAQCLLEEFNALPNLQVCYTCLIHI